MWHVKWHSLTSFKYFKTNNGGAQVGKSALFVLDITIKTTCEGEKYRRIKTQRERNTKPQQKVKEKPRAAESVRKLLKASSKVSSFAVDRAAGILILAMRGSRLLEEALRF